MAIFKNTYTLYKKSEYRIFKRVYEFYYYTI